LPFGNNDELTNRKNLQVICEDVEDEKIEKNLFVFF